jgi:exodeoxyribonuclease VII large subunit
MFAEKVSTNAAEWSVSDLAGALKRTLEEAFGHVRLRGEVSGYRGPHSSGHAYFCLKDQNARIDAVIWKGAFGRLKIRPEEGMEVIATGRISTFPGSSKYQVIVESLEPAGIGALMKLLEERRRKLTAEGLFDVARKRPLPYLPRVIGVVTSPTGAVIRDILHRLEDRFPRQVLVWPVRVQGETCAAEVAAAIRGFNALSPGGPIPRPDVLIVARGGGSIEDLWGFNEEVVIRAVAEGEIPLVSAVGHETDWTLIDHAADMRAPTPTGAAEMVVPVRADLVVAVQDLSRRHMESALRVVEHRRSDLRSAARALPAPDALFAPKRQRLDLAAAKLGPSLILNKRRFEDRLARTVRQLALHSPASRLAALRARLSAIDHRPREALGRAMITKADRLRNATQRLQVARDGLLRAELVHIGQRRELVRRSAERLVPSLWSQVERKRIRFDSASKLFGSLNYKAVLDRGYVLVRDGEGHPLRSADAVGHGQSLTLEFADGTVDAVGGRGLAKPPRLLKTKGSATDQGALF